MTAMGELGAVDPPASDAAEDWLPEDFIIDHQFCGVASIRRWVERWRIDRGLPWAVLLPFTRERGTVFGSLMILTGDDAPVVARLVQRLVDATTSSSASELEEVLHSLATLAETERPDEAIPADLFDRLLDTVVVTSISPLLGGDDTPLALYMPTSWAVAGGVRHFLLAPTDRASLAPAGPSVVRDPMLQELDVMLHATNQVVMHLHERTWRPMEESTPQHGEAATWHDRLDLDSIRLAPDISHFGPEHAYEDLLERSPAVHADDLAALYLIGRTGRELRLVAARNAPHAPEFVELDDATSPLAFTIDRNRPRVTNRVVTEPTLHSEIRSHWFGAAAHRGDFSELVVPVATSAMGLNQTVAGALVVQRDSGACVFDVRDLGDLEQLAVRISLRRANLLFSEATDQLAELTGRSMLSSVGPGLRDALPDRWRAIPADLVAARSTLEQAVSLAYQYTPAQRATLYLLNMAQDQLVPVASHGEGTPEVEGEIPVRLSGRKIEGLAAIAHATGADAVLRDVEDHHQVARFGGRVSKKRWAEVGARSGIGIPVTLYDRCVGVLHLQSLRHDAFVATHRYVQAVAQQIGLALLLAQRGAEQRAFAFASGTAVHAHEILKRVTQLQDLGSPAAAKLAKEIETHVDLLRTPDRTATGLSPDPYEVIQACLADVKLTRFAIWQNTPPSVPPIPQLVQLALKTAVREVVKNSKDYLVAAEGRLQVVLRGYETQRGGLPHLVVLVKQAVGQPVSESIVPLLYRVPIEHGSADGRRHFGAFIAGYWLRAVGGDVYLTQNATTPAGDHYVETAIDIPIWTLAPEAK